MTETDPHFTQLMTDTRNGNNMSGFKLLQYGIEKNFIPALQIADIEATLPGGELPPDIPKKIVQYWHNPHRPDYIDTAIESMKAHNPGYDHLIENDAGARTFIQAHFGPHYATLYDHCLHVTMKADFWRLCYLYIFGGIYIDIDNTCVAPLTTLMAKRSFECFFHYAVGKPWCVNNGFIVTTPKNSLIHALLNRTAANIEHIIENPASFSNVWELTGPGATTRAAMRQVALNPSLITPTPKGHIPLLLSHENTARYSYHHEEFAYKQTAEGNWRLFTNPHSV
ncbi:glycosyltransferase family 32 protein [Entomobacter blattae]|uniref:Glycosyltransferase sugar-binding region containing DXD motif protein n=1 Tax=Entomobacter blattae TaxID=2762277 RepID=A0A7H1NQJ0_9PROT|nr:glycosyltransferase [Entomobacter blattae]QNT78050.1 Glycosyltransferase sugar-binding region containing DXD motif protein [Entomobacter blattae]